MALNQVTLFHVTGVLDIKTELTPEEIYAKFNAGDQDEVVEIQGKHDNVGSVIIHVKRKCFVAAVTRVESLINKPKIIQ